MSSKLSRRDDKMKQKIIANLKEIKIMQILKKAQQS